MRWESLPECVVFIHSTLHVECSFHSQYCTCRTGKPSFRRAKTVSFYSQYCTSRNATWRACLRRTRFAESSKNVGTWCNVMKAPQCFVQKRLVKSTTGSCLVSPAHSSGFHPIASLALCCPSRVFWLATFSRLASLLPLGILPVSHFKHEHDCRCDPPNGDPKGLGDLPISKKFFAFFAVLRPQNRPQVIPRPAKAVQDGQIARHQQENVASSRKHAEITPPQSLLHRRRNSMRYT